MVLVFILERVHAKVELELKADSYIVLETSLSVRPFRTYPTGIHIIFKSVTVSFFKLSRE